METFTLEVITPERTILEEEVRSLVVPAEEGFLGVLPNHAPMLTTLGVGAASVVTAGGEEQTLLVAGGFLEVADNHARILAEICERPEEIDLERARRAEERARKRLEERASDVDFDLVRAEAALQRALVRQKLVSDLRR